MGAVSYKTKWGGSKNETEDLLDEYSAPVDSSYLDSDDSDSLDHEAGMKRTSEKSGSDRGLNRGRGGGWGLLSLLVLLLFCLVVYSIYNKVLSMEKAIIAIDSRLANEKTMINKMNEMIFDTEINKVLITLTTLSKHKDESISKEAEALINEAIKLRSAVRAKSVWNTDSKENTETPEVVIDTGETVEKNDTKVDLAK